MQITRLAALLLVLAAGPALAGGDTSQVPYPDGYRSWSHVKSLILQEGHPLYASFGGLHHVYANPGALQGLRTGTYPDGAVLVFDLLAVIEEGNAIAEGDRRLVGVMRKDRKAFAATGGWGFEGFAGASHTERLVTDATTQCFSCHQPQKDSDYVFSTWRE